MPLVVLNSSASQLAMVQSLDIRAWGYNPRPGDLSQALDLSHACRLRDLSIAISKHWAPASLAIAVPIIADPKSLWTLTLSGFVDPIVAFKVISQASSLRSLLWSPARELPPICPPEEQISLPFLKHLGLHESNALSILPHLHAPELLSFTLNQIYWMMEVPFPRPSQFLHLRVFNLILQRGFEFPALEAFLHGHPSLEVFSIQDQLLPGVALACMTAPKLRLVVANWVPGDYRLEFFEGPQLLLSHWCSQIALGNAAPDLHEMIFVDHPSYLEESRIEREEFEKMFVDFHGIILRTAPSNPFALWRPEDWDEWFQKTYPSYVPCF
ncbi:hypothetical protein DL93DRAFT_1876829 [Clavulina sp. PMI_390]|nr:hypothetical protein DL93DRAFT_1876829 [Clavulina sp. PMI_390]